MEIAEVLKSTATLTYLNISRNWIDKEGIMNILTTSRNSKTLHTLECIFNTLSQSDFITIMDYVRKENVLETLNASWNWITCGNYSFQKINTVMCYVHGHDWDTCKDYEHTESPYIDADPTLLNSVIHCCIKDSFVQELCLSTSSNIYPKLITISAKAILMNKSLAKIHIKYSHISYDEGLAISDCVKVNTVKELIISKCDLTNQVLRRIIDTIKYHKSTGLRQLCIFSIALSDGDMESISSCLKHNTTLQELVMCDTNINDNGALLIAEGILVNRTLLKLNISCNQISYKGVVAISDSLRYNSQLQKLDISYNKITLEGVKYLAKSVKTNTTLLELCMVQCCGKTVNSSSDASQAITSDSQTTCNYEGKVFLVAMEINQLRQKVTVETTNLFDNEIMAISDCLQNNKVLQNFTLFKCNLISENELQNICHEIKSSAEFDSIENNEESKIKFTELMSQAVDQTISKRSSTAIDCVKGNRTLTTLVIAFCEIGDEGAAVISDCIMHNTSIRELDLSLNFITNEGAVKLFKCIEAKKMLQSLNLSCNKISDDGALAASEYLKNNLTLLRLGMAHNDLQDDGVIAISDCLTTNTTLQQLSMTIKKISKKTTNRFATALARNKILHELSITKYGYSETLHDTIVSTMYDNSTMMRLTLPFTIDVERCILQNEVEKINIIRRSQEIDMLTVIFFEDLSEPFHYRLCSSS